MFQALFNVTARLLDLVLNILTTLIEYTISRFQYITLMQDRSDSVTAARVLGPKQA